MHYESWTTPVFERWLADLVRPIRSGDVNLYLLYVFTAVLVAYLVAAL